MREKRSTSHPADVEQRRAFLAILMFYMLYTDFELSQYERLFAETKKEKKDRRDSASEDLVTPRSEVESRKPSVPSSLGP